MISFKVLFILATLLVAVSADPSFETTIHSIRVIDNDQDVDIDETQVTDVNALAFLERARKLKAKTKAKTKTKTKTKAKTKARAVLAVKKVETGFARTANFGLTLQKGTSGIIHFRIRAVAVTVKQLAAKKAIFRRRLTKKQQQELSRLSRRYKDGFDIPWLKYLGVDLKNGTKKKDMMNSRRHIVGYDKLAALAHVLLKKTVARKIEVRGTVKATGDSFIPTTVYSFIRFAKIFLNDGSEMLVLSDRPGDTAAGTREGRRIVPHEGKRVRIS